MTYLIQKMPEAERPRERLVQAGPEAVSSAELIAIILGSGSKGYSVLQIAQDLLTRFGSLQKFAEASLEELMQVKGLGQAKAIQLKAALTLGLRASKLASTQNYRIITPEHAYHYIKDVIEGQKREIVIVILQNAKGHVMSHHTVEVGSLSQRLWSHATFFILLFDIKPPV